MGERRRFRRCSTKRTGAACAALLLACGLGAWHAGFERDAAACGRFYPARELRKPSLAHEQVAILYDASVGVEHFIREVAFNDATTHFGFVVPTPSRPEVAKVAKSPFEALRNSFDFAPRVGARAAGGTRDTSPTRGYGSSGLGSVELLEKVKVGSFTAFVLAADDEAAMAKWLRENGLSTTPESQEWLGHYVRLQFYFVAMRYDPVLEPKEATSPTRTVGVTRSETIRISFATPAPFYPYLEPRAVGELAGADRLLELWLVTNEPLTPVALVDEGEDRTWVRPLQPGLSYGSALASTVVALGSEFDGLLPKNDVVVQTFQDQKSSRPGFGDILFVPKERRPLEGRRKEALTRLAGLLDTSLVPVRRPQKAAP